MFTKLKIGFAAGLIALFFANVAPAQNFTGWKETKTQDEAAEAAGETAVDNILERVAASETAQEEPEATPASSSDLVETSRYTLGITDVIEVKVLRHPEVSGDYIINQEGNIQYEFVGDIKLAGLTKDEAAALVREKLAEYIISPEVSVKIIGYNSKVVYVVGEVGAPGKIFMRGDTISVRDALVSAGLPQLTGVTRRSRLITPSRVGKGDMRKLDVYALLYEGDLRQNFEMKPGDIIYIPATFLTKTMRALQPVTAPIGNAAGTGRTVTGGF